MIEQDEAAPGIILQGSRAEAQHIPQAVLCLVHKAQLLTLM